MASADSEGCAIVWDSSTGHVRGSRAELGRKVLRLALSPDARRMAVGFLDGTVVLWDVRSRDEAVTLNGHDGSVRSLVFSPDGRTLASSGADGVVRLWDADNGKMRAVLDGCGRALIGVAFSLTDRMMLILNKEHQSTQAYALSPDCKQMGMAGEMGLIRIWDLGKQTAIASWEGHVGTVTSLAYSPDGATLASGGLDGTVRLWCLEEQLKGKHE